MDAMTFSFFDETSVNWFSAAVIMSLPAVLGAAMNLGCGKKRAPVKSSSKSKKDVSVKVGGSLSKSKGRNAGSLSKSSKSAKVGAASSKSRSKSSKSGKDSFKSKKSSKKSINSSKQLKGVKQETSLKERSTQTNSAKVNSTKLPLSGTAPNSQQGIIEVERTLARAAHVAAAQGVDAILKSAKTQSVSITEPQDSAKEIKMEPAELRWSSTGGMQKISLFNQTGERQAVKVKCSDNNIYRVNPVYAFMEPGQTLNIDIMRQNGSNKIDKIVFVTTKASVDEANPKMLFKPGAPNSMMVLPLLASTHNEHPVAAAVN